MKFVADENFDNRILRGLLRRQPKIDIVRLQDTEAAGAADPAVLGWAAKEDRILLTHDQRTIPLYAYERIQSGELVAGVIVAGNQMPIGAVIEEIIIILACSSASEWVNQVQRLPL